MPIGKTVARPIKWPSQEFLDAYDDVCKRLDTNRTARVVQNALADIERHGTPEEIQTAREHLEGRARRGPKPKNPGTPAGGRELSAPEELAQWADLHDKGTITDEEYAAKKVKLLGL